jgi:hemerythrin superfamily protein
MDAITLLENDHRAVEDLFKKFEKAGDSAHKTKQKLVDRMIHELSIHAAVEETTFYPFVKGVNEELTSDVFESLEEHHVVKWLLSELDGMPATAERFDAKATVLMENVRHHVDDEEREMFPLVRKALSRDQLNELGELIERAKKVAPTRSHPKAPDEPPGNVVSTVVSGFIDRVRETAKQATRTATKASGTARRQVATRTGQTRKRTGQKRAPRKATARRG